MKFILLFSFLTVFVHAKTMFWEINGTHGGKVYLLGSMHVGAEEMYPLDPYINEAFEKSNYLFVEVKQNEKTIMTMNKALFQRGRYESNETIANHIAPETYTQMQEWLKTYQMPIDSLDQYKPWVAALNLSMFELMQLGFSPMYGIDKYFESKAKHMSKQIYSLEGVSEQIGVLMFDENDYQENFLKMVMSSKKASKSDMDILIDAYKEGNVSYFEQEVLAPINSYPKIKELLLTNRNVKMLEKIKRYINSKKGRKYFIVVGLAHLIGEEGLVEMIRASDYNVTRYE